jgi:16S rRNA (guanine527-N7)-methyltransferase
LSLHKQTEQRIYIQGARRKAGPLLCPSSTTFDHYIREVTNRRTVEEVLTTAQRVGTLGDRPIPEVIEHAQAFVAALADVTGTVIDIGTGAGVPGLVIAQERTDLALVLADRRATRMDALRMGVSGLGWEDRITVLTCDIADLGKQPEHVGQYDAVVCRGFGSPEVTAPLARPLLKNGGTLIVSEPPSPKPSRWTSELLEKTGFEPPEYLPGVVKLTAKP